MAGRITLYIATSVDGYVADADGAVDWLEAFGDDAGFEAFFESVDCLVLGATTYEQVLGFGDCPYGGTPAIVFTHRELPAATDAVTFTDRSVAEVVPELEREYDHVWLVGGASLARAFLRERSVDTLRLFLVPLLLGDGIGLFDGEYPRRRLRLVDAEARESGIVEQHYEFAE